MTVIAELDEIIQLLESSIPANPNSPKNLRQKDALRREMAKYFGKLEDAFPYGSLGKLYNKYVEKE